MGAPPPRDPRVKSLEELRDQMKACEDATLSALNGNPMASVDQQQAQIERFLAGFAKAVETVGKGVIDALGDLGRRIGQATELVEAHEAEIAAARAARVTDEMGRVTEPVPVRPRRYQPLPTHTINYQSVYAAYAPNAPIRKGVLPNFGDDGSKPNTLVRIGQCTRFFDDLDDYFDVSGWPGVDPFLTFEGEGAKEAPAAKVQKGRK